MLLDSLPYPDTTPEQLFLLLEALCYAAQTKQQVDWGDLKNALQWEEAFPNLDRGARSKFINKNFLLLAELGFVTFVPDTGNKAVELTEPAQLWFSEVKKHQYVLAHPIFLQQLKQVWFARFPVQNTPELGYQDMARAAGTDWGNLSEDDRNRIRSAYELLAYFDLLATPESMEPTAVRVSPPQILPVEEKIQAVEASHLAETAPSAGQVWQAENALVPTDETPTEPQPPSSDWTHEEAVETPSEPEIRSSQSEETPEEEALQQRPRRSLSSRFGGRRREDIPEEITRAAESLNLDAIDIPPLPDASLPPEPFKSTLDKRGLEYEDKTEEESRPPVSSSRKSAFQGGRADRRTTHDTPAREENSRQTPRRQTVASEDTRGLSAREKALLDREKTARKRQVEDDAPASIKPPRRETVNRNETQDDDPLSRVRRKLGGQPSEERSTADRRLANTDFRRRGPRASESPAKVVTHDSQPEGEVFEFKINDMFVRIVIPPEKAKRLSKTQLYDEASRIARQVVQEVDDDEQQRDEE